MGAGRFRFDRFTLDMRDRRLLRDDAPVELNARYLDALALLVARAGELVTKDDFLADVWRGVPVTDEALTQSIRTLRRQLGDDAARPRFIETVPKHGYRFIAAVTPADAAAAADLRHAGPSPDRWRQALSLGGAGAIGGGFAGFFGGLIYGLGGASQPLQPGMGAGSVLLVLLSLCILVGLTGGAGVGFGVAAAGAVARRRSPWTIAGGAFGGMAVGAIVKLLGLDAFTLLLGRSPGDITGGLEGALIGGAVGLGVWLGSRGVETLRRVVPLAALAGGVAGVLVALLGGRMMAGSLDLLARRFPQSRLRLDQIGGLFGEPAFGPLSRIVTAALEGALFAACVVGAMILARRTLPGGDDPSKLTARPPSPIPPPSLDNQEQGRG